jgi:integrase
MVTFLLSFTWEPRSSSSPLAVYRDAIQTVLANIGAVTEAGDYLALDGLTPHDLRHTAASLAVAAGANVKAVQRMLGHASATMTLDVYAGLFGDDLDTVADLLDEAARRAAADSLRTREATGRVLPFASGEGPRRDQGFSASPRGESNS